ncbi:MAG: response regulator [Candidatus Schekmanbacteria bacterium]|nr:response regulator [Candidatus Schekmanbacteria bacterium]
MWLPGDDDEAKTVTALVVEDLYDHREILRETLEELGVRVLEARDGREAIRVFKQHRAAVDLLVTDIVMPKMDGFELAERLRALAPPLRVLFVSGLSNPEPNSGMAYLEKPFRREDFIAAIQKLLPDLREP